MSYADDLLLPNVAAFLRVIREGESSQTEDAYRTLVGGGQFAGFDDHPRQAVWIDSLKVRSTAAGAYQFLSGTWDWVRKKLGLPDFSPHSQDLAALGLIDHRGALADVKAGRLAEAIYKCAHEWASLPGSPYGQPTLNYARCQRVYLEFGGQLADDPALDAEAQNSEAKAMPIPALVGALLPSIVEAIPALTKVFGSGSKVSERNAEAAQIVVDTVKKATNAVNEQEAVQKLKTDPVALQAAQRAVADVWFQISEVGAGGIEAARKADLEQQKSGDLMHSASFWVALLLLPLVYLIVASLIGLVGTAEWSADVRAGLAGSIISAIIGGLVGYYYGQTTSRNRTSTGGQ